MNTQTKKANKQKSKLQEEKALQIFACFAQLDR
jgi:hypothetical protein